MVKQNRNYDKKQKNLKRTPKKRLAGIPAKFGRCPICGTIGMGKPAEAGQVGLKAGHRAHLGRGFVTGGAESGTPGGVAGFVRRRGQRIEGDGVFLIVFSSFGYFIKYFLCGKKIKFVDFYGHV
ncbi:MAG: hypothetical protein K6F06_07350 [Bacteroidales bacterium]|nr:hypothetical protein [Bacteroidales bacterium]